jgi:hypothetical protein
MRSPTPSFKSELIAFRDSRHPTTEPGSNGPLGLGNRNSADMELLDRWLDDERSEESWNKVKCLAPNLLPAEYIQAVLTARRAAGASVNRTIGVPGVAQGFNNEWAALLPDLKKRIAKRLSKSPSATMPIEVAEFLEDAAREIRTLHQFYFGFSDQVGFGLVRQGSNTDRGRVAFYRLMTDFLQKLCGQKLYDVTAQLSEVAFPGRPVDQDNVIDALKPRRNPRRPKPSQR